MPRLAFGPDTAARKAESNLGLPFFLASRAYSSNDCSTVTSYDRIARVIVISVIVFQSGPLSTNFSISRGSSMSW
jgi:hypothetical protein